MSAQTDPATPKSGTVRKHHAKPPGPRMTAMGQKSGSWDEGAVVSNVEEIVRREELDSNRLPRHLAELVESLLSVETHRARIAWCVEAVKDAERLVRLREGELSRVEKRQKAANDEYDALLLGHVPTAHSSVIRSARPDELVEAVRHLRGVREELSDAEKDAATAVRQYEAVVARQPTTSNSDRDNLLLFLNARGLAKKRELPLSVAPWFVRAPLEWYYFVGNRMFIAARLSGYSSYLMFTRDCLRLSSPTGDDRVSPSGPRTGSEREKNAAAKQVLQDRHDQYARDIVEDHKSPGDQRRVNQPPQTPRELSGRSCSDVPEPDQDIRPSPGGSSSMLGGGEGLSLLNGQSSSYDNTSHFRGEMVPRLTFTGYGNYGSGHHGGDEGYIVGTGGWYWRNEQWGYE
ncbi:hypothetical protein BC834DRAFT_845313 [Gloeopeniophorella convolvens]|nr:hypothetical protein BC834DRAFT_845313 [Gloeopeniophorella convolvens]